MTIMLKIIFLVAAAGTAAGALAQSTDAARYTNGQGVEIIQNRPPPAPMAPPPLAPVKEPPAKPAAVETGRPDEARWLNYEKQIVGGPPNLILSTRNERL